MSFSTRPKREPTAATVAEGLSRLALSTESLRAEVQQLRAALKDFGPVPPKRIRSFWRVTDKDAHPLARLQTDEPRSQSDRAIEEIGEADDAAAQMHAIRALQKDLDGAFLDIRATRTDLEAIVGRPDSRSRFQAWYRKR